MSRSFIDLLFILLCGTIVMLSESLQVGALEAAPARVGAGGVTMIEADAVTLVTVEGDTLRMADPAGSGRTVSGDAATIHALLDDPRCVLLAAAREEVSHAAVMRAWSRFRDLGRAVRLAATPENPDDRTGQP